MNTKIVQRIKLLRIERNLTTKFMAEKLNIDLSAHNRMESGYTQ